jgi:hypothetical protein
MMGYNGFAAVLCGGPENGGRIHRLGWNFLMFLLVLATDPIALRMDVFWRDHALVYLSRAALGRRYGGVTSR